MKLSTLHIAVALCAAPLASQADISWVIKPAASTSGRMQLFASRADKPLPRTIIVDTPKNAKQYRNIRFGNRDKNIAFAGINVHGLAVAFTGAGPSLDPISNKPKKGQPAFTGNYAAEQILRNCKTAKQAVGLLRKANGRFYGTLIFLIADANQVCIFECSSRHMASYEMGLNYTVYSNVWKLPGMEDASARNPEKLASYAQREWIAKTGIHNARKGDRKVSITEAIAVSRLSVADAKRKDVTSAPSVKNSIDAYIFEIDKKYPGILSCVYAAMGPQRHTVYLPIPLGAMDALPKELVNGAWATFGDEAARKSTPEAPVSEEIIELERGLHQEFNDIRYKAAQLLDENKTDEAKAVLRDMLQRQTQEVMKFMQEHK